MKGLLQRVSSRLSDGHEYEVLKDLRLPTYRNTTEVCHINGTPMSMEDVIKAAIISRSNILLLGERGEGKTQLMYDVLNSWFGGRGTYLRVSPDLDLKSLYQRINLHKLREAGTTDEIKEITSKITDPIYTIDEINRAPPIVQNQLMNICDGYVEIEGKKYPLGNKGYSVGIATANIGSSYVGTFDMDPALLDRFHLTMDVDNFPPKPLDTFEILLNNSEPRIADSEKEDHTDDIIALSKIVDERCKRPPLTVLIGELYLVHGLDYIDIPPHHSKRRYKNWHSSMEGSHESASYLGLISPISKRMAKSVLRLYTALEMVAEAKGHARKPEYQLENFWETVKITLPYSGALQRPPVETIYHGNPYEAMEKVVEQLKEMFRSKESEIGVAVKEVKEKKALTQHTLEKFQKDWEFFKDFLIESQEKYGVLKESEKGD